MKKQFLKLNVQRTLRTQTTPRRTKPFSDVRTAGILYAADAAEKVVAAEIMRRNLESQGIRTTLLAFSEHPAAETATGEEHIFTLKDFNVWGRLRNATVEAFIRQEFDYLFAADRVMHPAIELVLASSRAHCRAGICSEQSNPFLDVMIQADGNLEQLMNELLNLIRKLH